MKAVMDRFMKDEAFLNFESYFLFKSNRELEQGFFSDWHRASGELENFVDIKRLSYPLSPSSDKK